jgi:hypothetical protein
MPTEGLNVALALLGISLAGGGLYWSFRLRVQLRRRGGSSMSVAVDVSVRQTTQLAELTELVQTIDTTRSTGTDPARHSERHER